MVIGLAKNQKGELMTGSGIGIVGTLAVVFVVLKLTNNIDWSWWWVLSPIWIPIGIVPLSIFLIIISFGITSLLMGDIDKYREDDY